MMVNAMETVDDGGASQEKPVFAPGAAGVRSTRVVNFHTGKELHDAQRCHLNAAVFDFGWEREAGELLDSHPAVPAWVKNDRLGLGHPLPQGRHAPEVPAGFRGRAEERRAS